MNTFFETTRFSIKKQINYSEKLHLSHNFILFNETKMFFFSQLGKSNRKKSMFYTREMIKISKFLDFDQFLSFREA